MEFVSTLLSKLHQAVNKTAVWTLVVYFIVEILGSEDHRYDKK